MKALLHFLYRDIILPVNILILTPMWLMALGLTLYAYALRCSILFLYNNGRGGEGETVFSGVSLTLLLLYALHVVCFDRRSSEGHWARNHWSWTASARRFPGFTLAAAYFPVTLHKTVDLPAVTDHDKRRRSYLFLYHPHGVISMGCNTALNTNGCGFDTLFPGLQRRYGVTLPIAFMVPLVRECLAVLGYISSRQETLVRILRDEQASVVLVPGGALEALYAQPGTWCCREKSAPLRLAQCTGAWLVPCLGFGENDAFSVMHIPRLMPRQVWLCRTLSFATPLLISPLPRRRPIHVVVGAPLPPSTTLREYRGAVECLYQQHRGRFGHAEIAWEWIARDQTTSAPIRRDTTTC